MRLVGNLLKIKTTPALARLIRYIIRKFDFGPEVLGAKVTEAFRGQESCQLTTEDILLGNSLGLEKEELVNVFLGALCGSRRYTISVDLMVRFLRNNELVVDELKYMGQSILPQVRLGHFYELIHLGANINKGSPLRDAVRLALRDRPRENAFEMIQKIFEHKGLEERQISEAFEQLIECFRGNHALFNGMTHYTYRGGVRRIANILLQRPLSPETIAEIKGKVDNYISELGKLDVQEEYLQTEDETSEDEEGGAQQASGLPTLTYLKIFKDFLGYTLIKEE